MARLPHLPSNASRFFARLRAADLECPRCGMVLVVYGTGTRSKLSPQPRGEWDKTTSVLTCPGCRQRMVLGVIAWPLEVGGERVKPADQVPNERQTAELRALGSQGWYMPEAQRLRRRRALDTNITAACTCGTSTYCLLHPK